MNAPLSISPRQPVFLHEYQSDGLKRHSCVSSINFTTLFVVFDGETHRRFSSVRIVLYCDKVVSMDIREASAIRQLEPISCSSGDHCDHHVPHNGPALPQLIVAFKVLRTGDEDYPDYDLVPPSLVDELCRRDSNSVCILLESKHSVSSGALSLAFEHSDLLHTPSNQLDRYSFCAHTYLDDNYAKDYVTTRTVRVVPMDGVRPRIATCSLPTELLMRVFEATDSCACQWQHDLLSFAQVCRQWSQCSMNLLFTRLESSEWRGRFPFFPHSLGHFAFAMALRKTPFLGLGVQDLHLDQHNGSWSCQRWNHDSEITSPRFAQALITILHATKNLQRLHLSLGFSTQTNALFSTLPKVDDLHTLSITQTKCRLVSTPPTKYWTYSINTFQLARCMTRWPALTSLTVEHLKAGNIGIGRFFLRSPACALTQLCIRDSYMSGKDLLYLTASSAHTLAQVTLDRVRNLTDDGLRVFLDAISRNVTSLTIRDVQSPESPSHPKERHALDAVVDKMRCLQALNIRGDVASERMLRRRSETFSRSRGSGVPMVRLSFEAVPGIRKCKDGEWAGWEVVEAC